MPRQYTNARQESFIEDLRVLWNRGLRTRSEFIKAMNIKSDTFDQRIYRARQRGALPKARHANVFDPLGKIDELWSAYYAPNRKHGERRATTPKLLPKDK